MAGYNALNIKLSFFKMQQST